MDLVQNDKLKGLKVPVWDQYSALLKQAGSDVRCHHAYKGN